MITDSSSAAYKAGWEASSKGVPRSANPHPPKTTEAEDWDYGWEEQAQYDAQENRDRRR